MINITASDQGFPPLKTEITVIISITNNTLDVEMQTSNHDEPSSFASVIIAIVFATFMVTVCLALTGLALYNRKAAKKRHQYEGKKIFRNKGMWLLIIMIYSNYNSTKLNAKAFTILI